MSPFDYSQAFDHALKEVVKRLPNRPEKEKLDEVVCFSGIPRSIWNETGLIVCLYRTIIALISEPLEIFLATPALSVLRT
jgi:hypothetical protein